MNRTLKILFLLLLIGGLAWAADDSVSIPNQGKNLDMKSRTTGAGSVLAQAGVICHPTSTDCLSINSTGSLHATLKDTSGNAVGVSGLPLRIDPTGTTTQPVAGTLTNNGAAASTAQVAALTGVATAAVPTYTEGRSTALSQDLSGLLRVTVPESGLSHSYRSMTASTNAINVKASAGVLYAWSCSNTDTTNYFLAFHNTAGTPTAGSGVVERFLIPANSSGQTPNIGVDGDAFTTGIAYTVTAGEADSSSSAVSNADKVKCTFWYR